MCPRDFYRAKWRSSSVQARARMCTTAHGSWGGSRCTIVSQVHNNRTDSFARECSVHIKRKFPDFPFELATYYHCLSIGKFSEMDSSTSSPDQPWMSRISRHIIMCYSCPSAEPFRIYPTLSTDKKKSSLSCPLCLAPINQPDRQYMHNSETTSFRQQNHTPSVSLL